MTLKLEELPDGGPVYHEIILTNFTDTTHTNINYYYPTVDEWDTTPSSGRELGKTYYGFYIYLLIVYDSKNPGIQDDNIAGNFFTDVPNVLHSTGQKERGIF
ncbi:MAG TPA: hypothetical protein DIT07_11520 [Sphingobacteriaceae bacterium]|nr:hypothetical protein [Sphingobacteriaceae bacterium]